MDLALVSKIRGRQKTPLMQKANNYTASTLDTMPQLSVAQPEEWHPRMELDAKIASSSTVFRQYLPLALL